MVGMDIHRQVCVSTIIRFWHSIHSHTWLKKIMEILTSIMHIMIERWIYTYLSWTIDIKSQLSIIKWRTSILTYGYPLYRISNHTYTRLFALGFPCIHISDWQMKIMDILNSIKNTYFFNCRHLSNLSWTICIKSQISITELWISIIQLWDTHVIELWISINNYTYRWSFAVVFHTFTYMTDKWKSMIIVKLILGYGHTWLSYGYP